MKKHFSFEKFRIKTKKNNLNFIDVFNNDKKIHNIIRFNSHLKSKEINLYHYLQSYLYYLNQQFFYLN